MKYTVFVYKGGIPESQKTFNSIQEAFEYLGRLNFAESVERCILDDGTKILFDLVRDANGQLHSN